MQVHVKHTVNNGAVDGELISVKPGWYEAEQSEGRHQTFVIWVPNTKYAKTIVGRNDIDEIKEA